MCKGQRSRQSGLSVFPGQGDKGRPDRPQSIPIGRIDGIDDLFLPIPKDQLPPGMNAGSNGRNSQNAMTRSARDKPFLFHGRVFALLGRRLLMALEIAL